MKIELLEDNQAPHHSELSNRVQGSLRTATQSPIKHDAVVSLGVVCVDSSASKAGDTTSIIRRFPFLERDKLGRDTTAKEGWGVGSVLMV